MASDRTLEVRRAAMIALKADGPLTELVPATSIHPQATEAMPPFPFARMGTPTSLPLKAAGIDGSIGSFTVHGFSRGIEDGTITETAEDHAARIGAAIAKALDGRVLEMDDGDPLKVRWTVNQLLQDPDTAGCFHVIASFGYRALS